MVKRYFPPATGHKKTFRHIPEGFEVLNGFEPMIRELQSHALPLGYSTVDSRRGPPNESGKSPNLYP